MSYGPAMVYQDPITRKRPEGEVELLERLDDEDELFRDEQDRPYRMTRWRVRFRDGGEVVERDIRWDGEVIRTPPQGSARDELPERVPGWERVDEASRLIELAGCHAQHGDRELVVGYLMRVAHEVNEAIRAAGGSEVDDFTRERIARRVAR